MKYSLFFPISVFIYSLISCNQNKQTQISNEHISFDTDTVFIPKIPIGDSIKRTFNFTNTGSNDLRILNVGSSCECTVGKFDSAQIIKPGDKGFINVVYKNSFDTGRIIRVIVIETNIAPRLHPVYLYTLK